MAWEHFTDYLNPGDIITHAQWTELLAAVMERMNVLATSMAVASSQPVYTWEADWLSQANATRICSRQVLPESNGSLIGHTTFFNMLNERSARFSAAPSPSPNIQAGRYGFSGNSFFADIATELGTTTAALSPHLNTPINTSAYWNIVRAGVKLLRYPIWMGAYSEYWSPSSAMLRNALNPNDATAQGIFLSGESSTGDINCVMEGGLATQYFYNGIRTTWSDAFTRIPVPTRLTAYVFTDSIRPNGFNGPTVDFLAGDTLGITLGGNAFTTPPLVGGMNILDMHSSPPITLSTDLLSFRLGGYDNPALYAGSAMGRRNRCHVSPTGFVFAPEFNFP